MDLLQSLLKKDPEERISASAAIKHEAFENVEDQDDGQDLEDNDGENQTMHHLRDFHEK